MKHPPPRLINQICARPVAICWVLGASAVGYLVFGTLSDGVRIVVIATDWLGMVFLALAGVAVIGLGFFLGMFTCWPWVRPLCSRINGAPFKVGDQVRILAGPLRGTTAEVEDVRKGQGGWNLAFLDLGPERRRAYTNIFEEYSLVRV